VSRDVPSLSDGLGMSLSNLRGQSKIRIDIQS
jgi:hypothetical protein